MLTKNPHYHDAENVSIDTVRYIPTGDDATEYRQYRAGQLDITSTIPYEQVDAAVADRPSETHICPTLGVSFYLFNMERSKFRDERVRRALSMAVDRVIIAEKVDRARQIPATSFVPPATRNYEPPGFPWQELSVEERVQKARRLLEEAGYDRREPLSIEVLYRTDENIKQRTIALAAMWKHLGVTVRLRNEEWKVYLESRRQTDFDISVGGWVAEYNDPHAFLQILHTNAGDYINNGRYSNDRYDRLLDMAAIETDADTRMRQLADAERIVLHDAPVIPIYFTTARSLVKPHVRGFKENVMRIHPSRWMSVSDR